MVLKVSKLILFFKELKKPFVVILEEIKLFYKQLEYCHVERKTDIIYSVPQKYK